MRSVAVVGSRDHQDRDAVFAVMQAIVSASAGNDPESFGIKFVLGDCPTGVDAYAREFVMAHDLWWEHHLAAWDEHGKKAGPIRTRIVVERSDEVHAIFWRKATRGTRNACTFAVDSAKPLRTYIHGRSA